MNRIDLVAEQQWEKALGVFAEAVRRQPADHRSRMLADPAIRYAVELISWGKVFVLFDKQMERASLLRVALGVAEYHAAKERQGMVNARLGQLRAQLRKLSMIDVSRIPRDRVGLVVHDRPAFLLHALL